MTGLHWLPAPPASWREQVRSLAAEPEQAWAQAVALANFNLPFLLTNALDQAVRHRLTEPPVGARHQAGAACHPGILHDDATGARHPCRRAAPRHLDRRARGRFRPVFAGPLGPWVRVARIQAECGAGGAGRPPSGGRCHAGAGRCGRSGRAGRNHGPHPGGLAPGAGGVPLPDHPADRAAGSSNRAGQQRTPARRLPRGLHRGAQLPAAGRGRPRPGVDILALDQRAAQDGIAAWHNTTLWHHAKQEITPAAGPVYGDLVARLLAAKQGRSAKCLVLDLDNTVWGGVVGDDGLEGIVIGQGSALRRGLCRLPALLPRTRPPRRHPGGVLQER